MSTFLILIGFALMLITPCAIAVFGTRERDDDSVYTDRLVEPIVLGPRVIQPPPVPAPIAAAAPVATPTKPAVANAAAAIPLEASDPILHNRAQKTYKARILRNEIEALMATAAAARAQAEALAANARLAAAKAEAADATATAAEDAAAEAIQEMRRAA